MELVTEPYEIDGAASCYSYVKSKNNINLHQLFGLTKQQLIDGNYGIWFYVRFCDEQVLPMSDHIYMMRE